MSLTLRAEVHHFSQTSSVLPWHTAFPWIHMEPAAHMNWASVLNNSPLDTDMETWLRDLPINNQCLGFLQHLSLHHGCVCGWVATKVWLHNAQTLPYHSVRSRSGREGT